MFRKALSPRRHDAPATVARMTQRLTPGTATAADDSAAAVGRQRGGRPDGAGPDPAGDAELLPLGAGLCHPAAAGQLGAAPFQWPVAALAALRAAGPAGRGRLQRPAIPGAADLHAAQRDAGGVQHPAVDAGHRCAVLRRQGDTGTTAGAALSMAGVLVVLSRGNWAQLLQLRLVTGDLFMLLATAGLGLVQLAADAPRRAVRNPR